MCGEHWGDIKVFDDAEGSSPHVRGAPMYKDANGIVRGIIPACAGSTSYSPPKRCPSGDHPRMCGEHCLRKVASAASMGSSPHVRGALTA